MLGLKLILVIKPDPLVSFIFFKTGTGVIVSTCQLYKTDKYKYKSQTIVLYDEILA